MNTLHFTQSQPLGYTSNGHVLVYKQLKKRSTVASLLFLRLFLVALLPDSASTTACSLSLGKNHCQQRIQQTASLSASTPRVAIVLGEEPLFTKQTNGSIFYWSAPTAVRMHPLQLAALDACCGIPGMSKLPFRYHPVIYRHTTDSLSRRARTSSRKAPSSGASHPVCLFSCHCVSAHLSRPATSRISSTPLVASLSTSKDLRQDSISIRRHMARVVSKRILSAWYQWDTNKQDPALSSEHLLMRSLHLSTNYWRTWPSLLKKICRQVVYCIRQLTIIILHSLLLHFVMLYLLYNSKVYSILSSRNCMLLLKRLSYLPHVINWKF